MLKNFAFQRSNKPLRYVEYISMLVTFENLLKSLLQNSPPLPTHILFGFLPSEIIYWNALTIVLPFLSLKGMTQVYLLKKSIAHNKYLIPLLYLLNDCISVKSTPQILSLKDE